MSLYAGSLGQNIAKAAKDVVLGRTCNQINAGGYRFSSNPVIGLAPDTLVTKSCKTGRTLRESNN